MSSPTQRSLNLLRGRGYTACVVEKWVPQAKVRRDAFGFGDILAFCEGNNAPNRDNKEILLVQVTTRANLNARVKKMQGIREVSLWRVAGGKVEAHGWSKKGPRGKRKTWQVEVVRWP